MSVDYDTTPPRDATLTGCETAMQIADMDFDGDGLGVIGGIMSLFEGLLWGTVESKVQDAVCSELRKLAGEGGGEGVGLVRPQWVEAVHWTTCSWMWVGKYASILYHWG